MENKLKEKYSTIMILASADQIIFIFQYFSLSH